MYNFTDVLFFYKKKDAMFLYVLKLTQKMSKKTINENV